MTVDLEPFKLMKRSLDAYNRALKEIVKLCAAVIPSIEPIERRKQFALDLQVIVERLKEEHP